MRDFWQVVYRDADDSMEDGYGTDDLSGDAYSTAEESSDEE